jgi:hypothetical protein
MPQTSKTKLVPIPKLNRKAISEAVKALPRPERYKVINDILNDLSIEDKELADAATSNGLGIDEDEEEYVMHPADQASYEQGLKDIAEGRVIELTSAKNVYKQLVEGLRHFA